MLLVFELLVSVVSLNIKYCCEPDISEVLRYSAFSTSQELGWEERLRNDQFFVQWDVKP